jgi:hypothetical protein
MRSWWVSGASECECGFLGGWTGLLAMNADGQATARRGGGVRGREEHKGA